MPSNVALNAGSGGANAATKQRTHDGDTAQVQVVTLAGVTGTEDSYTFADIAHGGGVEAAALRVTLASDSTGVLSVDDNGGSLTVDGTVELGATSLAALETIELGATSLAALESLTTITTVTTVGAVTAITNALPAGTNNIGDVDVLSIVPGTSATSLGKAEDAAHASGDTGVMALAVRRDADTTLAATDGDYVPLQCNASGSLKVAITAGAGSGGTSIADGASFTRDTTSITPAGAVVESSAPTLTNGDVAGLSMTTGGALRTAVVSGGIAGAVVDSVAGATDEGVLSVVVRDDALATLTPVDGDYTQMRTNARGALWVALDSTAAQTVTLAAGTATNEIVGDVAQDAAVAGNPVLVGGRASTATPTAMSADGDSVYQWLTRNGATVVSGDLVDDAAFTPGTSRVQAIGLQADETATDSVDEGDIGAPRMSLDRKQYVIAHEETSTIYQNGTARTPVFLAIDAATSGDNTLLAAQGAGNKIRVHQLLLVAAGSVNVRFESGAGGSALSGQMNLVANTGFVLPYSPIGWFETAANTLLNLELSAAVSVDGLCAYTVVT